MGAAVTAEPKSKSKPEVSAEHTEPVPSAFDLDALYGAPAGMPLFLEVGLQRKVAPGAGDDPSDRAANSTAERTTQNRPLLRSLVQATTHVQRKCSGCSGPHKCSACHEEEIRIQSKRAPGSSPGALIQRACACGGTCAACQGSMDAEEPELLQRNAPMGAEGGVADEQIIPADSPGHPLDDSTRTFMERRFGSDFSDVRLHTDSRAAQSADTLSAEAYTTGRDIYFAAGKYVPGSQEGQHLIAHELTHTQQQQEGATLMAASRAGGVLVGDAADPLETEAEHTADTVMGAGRSTAQASKDPTPAVRRDLASGAAAVWNATGGRVVRGVEAVWDEAKETAAAFIDRMFPGLLPLLRNASDLLYQKITSGMDAAFNGIASRVRKQGVAGAITGLLSEMAGSIGKSLGQLITGSCHSMVEAASSIIHFVKGIASDAFAELGKIAKEVGDFFSGIWNDYGAPALDAIKKVAGEAWAWITEKAQWVWDKLLPIRNAFSKAWNWIKGEFNIAKEGTEGILDWLYAKAKEQWMKIRDKIAPILGPLKMVAGALLLFSPLGPVILIWKGAPLLWQGLQWIWAHGIKPAGEKIRAEFREHVLPYILKGIDAATERLDEASNFLCQHASTISSGLHSLEEALGNIPFLSFASRMVGFAAGFFDNLAAKGKCKFSDVIAEVKGLLNRIHQFLKPVLEALRQAVLIAELGPLALIDDGVWKTFTSFIALVKRTPCIREIAGLLQMDWVVDKITEIRTQLKDIYEVVTNQDKFEAAIHKALDASLAKIPGQAYSILGTILGMDGPHLDSLTRRFIVPKIAQTIARAPQMLIDMVWGLVWPWPGVMKQWDEIKDQGGKLKSALWDFEFSKAIDAGLAIWRGVNGIIGQLYGWFFLAAVLIGAVFGAPQAGAAVAYEVGEVLLVSTIVAEGLSIEKAKLNLMSDARQHEPVKDREAHDDEDYETISGSVMNLAVMGALAVLGEIAVDFAKSIFAEIKGLFTPRGVEPPPVEIPAPAAEPPKVGEPVKPAEAPKVGEPVQPAEPPKVGEPAKPAEPPKAAEPVKPAEPPKAGEPAKPGEPPKAAEPAKSLTEDALADAEKKGVPREELEPEVGELRQKAADAKNVWEPADPAYDAEMESDGHTFDREKSSRSWCRNSVKVCDLNLGDDLNAKVDSAKAAKTGEPPVVTDELLDLAIEKLQERHNIPDSKIPELREYLRSHPEELADLADLYSETPGKFGTEDVPPGGESQTGGSKPAELGKIGEDLSRNRATAELHETWITDQPAFKVKTADGGVVEFRADLGTRGAGGEPTLVDAKYGPGAGLEEGQAVGYPIMATEGGVPANAAAEQFARALFPDWKPGQPIPAVRVRIEYWRGTTLVSTVPIP